MSRRVLRGELLVATAAVLWALIGVCTRELADLGLPAEQVGAWRALIGGTCFVAHLLVRMRGPERGFVWRRYRAARGRLVVFGAVGVVVFYAALPLAVDTGGISLAWVLLYTAPIWVSLGAAVFLGERIGASGAVAVAVSVGGVVALVSSVGGTVEVNAASITWGLVAGVSYSSYYLVGRRLFETVGAVATYAVVLPAGGIALAVMVRLDSPSVAMIPWLVVVGVGCTYLPYLAFGHGIQDVPSSRAVIVATVEPVVATVLGVVLYGETLGVVGVFGAVAVLGAAVAVGLQRDRPAPSNPLARRHPPSPRAN